MIDSMDIAQVAKRRKVFTRRGGWSHPCRSGRLSTPPAWSGHQIVLLKSAEAKASRSTSVEGACRSRSKATASTKRRSRNRRQDDEQGTRRMEKNRPVFFTGRKKQWAESLASCPAVPSNSSKFQRESSGSPDNGKKPSAAPAMVPPILLTVRLWLCRVSRSSGSC